MRRREKRNSVVLSLTIPEAEALSEMLRLGLWTGHHRRALRRVALALEFTKSKKDVAPPPDRGKISGS